VNLLVARRIHEAIELALAVEVLHLPLVEHRAFDVFFRPEFVIHETARADVAHLGLNGSALVPRRHVQGVFDTHELTFVLDEHALT